jgi:hypothetical protein
MVHVLLMKALVYQLLASKAAISGSAIPDFSHYVTTY